MNNVIEELEKNYYSRWATNDEMLHNNDIDAVNLGVGVSRAGIPIGMFGDKLIVDSSIGHNLVIGGLGSGKTQSTVLPMLYLASKAGESVVVKDTTGELYKYTAKQFENRGYDIVVINFNEPDKGNCWNPFTLAIKLYKEGNKDDAFKIVESFSKTINHTEGNVDPFWTNTASQYMTGLVLSLIENAKEEEVNLGSLSYLTTLSDEELLDEYISKIDKDSIMYKYISSTHLAPHETKASIISVLNQKLTSFLNSNSLNKMLSSTDFDFVNLANKKTIIYLETTSGVEENDILFNTFIKQINYVLKGNKIPFNIILDDFDTNNVPIDEFDALLDEARRNCIRFTIIINGISNLNKTYKKEQIEMLRYACSNILYLYSEEESILRFISNICGKKDGEKNLVSAEALRRMNQWSALYIKRRCMPYPAVLVPFYKLPIESNEPKDFEIKNHKEVSVFKIEL